MRVQAPCKDCSNRELGCHSTCEKYIQYQKDNIAESQVRRYFLKNHNEHLGYLRDQKIKRENRTLRRSNYVAM